VVLFEHMGMEEQLVLPLVELISRIPRAVASATTEGGMRPEFGVPQNTSTGGPSRAPFSWTARVRRPG